MTEKIICVTCRRPIGSGDAQRHGYGGVSHERDRCISLLLAEIEGERKVTAPGCECASIMALDATRHFRGCPLREKYPTHEAEKLDEAAAVRRNAQPTNVRRNARPVRRIIEQDAPVIVVLCGSTRFSKAFADANLTETLAGKIVLTVGSMTHSDSHIRACIKCGRVEGVDVREGDFCKTAAVGKDNAHEFHPLNSEHHVGTKGKLDTLHKKKIEMADEVFVLNAEVCVLCKKTRGVSESCSGSGEGPHQFAPYIGDSTRGEIAHALKLGKPVRFLNQQFIDAAFWKAIQLAEPKWYPAMLLPHDTLTYRLERQ